MQSAKLNATSFLAPKYWPTWFGLGVLRLLALLPYRMQMKIGQFLGYISYKLMPTRRSIVQTNIRICFPSLSENEREALVKKAFASTGMAVLEVGISWWASKSLIKKLHKVEGIEHLNSALAENKGVILLVSHFTTMEIAGTFIGTHIDNFKVVYKYSHNPLFEWFMQKKRLKNCAGLLQHKNLRDIIRSIKQGDVVWYSPDQDFGHKDSIFAPFMGVSTCTLLSTQKLAKITQAPVVPFYVERDANLNGYTIRFSPALDNFPTDDAVADATKINTAIEQQIIKTPEQYLWAHRRFKSRPPGEENFYVK